MDRFPNTQQEYYDDLKRGKVDNHDFERYIYGSQSKKRTDEQDGIADKVRRDQAKMGRQMDDLVK